MKEEKFVEVEAELEAMVMEEEEIQRLLQNFECYLNLARRFKSSVSHLGSL